jgi:hypothetical protein
MTTSTASLNNLVTVIALIGPVFSGYTGTTVWNDKGGSPGGGFLLGGLPGPLGVLILVVATPGQKEIHRVARSRGLVHATTAQNSSRARRACAGTADMTSLPLRAVPCDCRRRSGELGRTLSYVGAAPRSSGWAARRPAHWSVPARSRRWPVADKGPAECGPSHLYFDLGTGRTGGIGKCFPLRSERSHGRSPAAR